MSPSAWVLDTPALTAYARGSIFLAALVSSLAREESVLLVPAACLMEAHASDSDIDLLDLLVSFKGVHPVALSADAARGAGQLWRFAPRSTCGAMHAVRLALELGAPVVTDDAKRLAGLLPDEHLVYTIPPE